MARSSPLIYVFEGDKLVSLFLHQPTATTDSPNTTELELVRLFNEHKALQSENEKLKDVLKKIAAFAKEPIDEPRHPIIGAAFLAKQVLEETQ